MPTNVAPITPIRLSLTFVIALFSTLTTPSYAVAIALPQSSLPYYSVVPIWGPSALIKPNVAASTSTLIISSKFVDTISFTSSVTTTATATITSTDTATRTATDTAVVTETNTLVPVATASTAEPSPSLYITTVTVNAVTTASDCLNTIANTGTPAIPRPSAGFVSSRNGTVLAQYRPRRMVVF